MKKLSLSGAALGILAATLAGCADEEAASDNDTQQAKAAITSRGFLVNGCEGSAIFDINSSSVLSYVALDQTSFNSVKAQLFALDKNKQEQLVAQSSEANTVSESMQSLFDKVSNFTSAYQASNFLSAQIASSRNNAFTKNDATSFDTATTTTSSAHARDALNRVITRSNTSGYNDTESWNDANTWANNSSRSSAFNASRSASSQAADQGSSNRADSWASNRAAQGQRDRAHAAQSNAANSRASNSADSWASNRAAQGQSDHANSYQNSGNKSNASNAATSRASSRAFDAASQFNVVAADIDSKGKKGFGFGGFGFGDIANRNSFATVSSRFNNADSSLFNSQWAENNNRAFANLSDSQFSRIFDFASSHLANDTKSHLANDSVADSKSNQFSTSFNNAASHLADDQQSSTFSDAKASAFDFVIAANENSTWSNLHNDTSSHDAFRTNAETDDLIIQKDRLTAYDTATTTNKAAQSNATRSANGMDSHAFDLNKTRASQISAQDASNRSINKQSSEQYQAMTNLEQFQTTSFVLRVDVTANSDSAILRVFTGNNARNVAANQDFSQNFFGCGKAASIGSGRGGKKDAILLPSKAHDFAPTESIELGDHVAVKPGE